MKNNKILKYIFKTLQVLVYVALALFVFVVVLQRFSDNKISFFNYRMFTVISESMAPKYKVGDILVSKEVNPSKIKVGDVISYKGTSGSFQGKIITHQVTEINKNSSGKYIFHAKGLANIIEDPLVYEDQLYGVVVYKTKILSLIYKIIATPVGFILFVLIPITVTIGTEIIENKMEKIEKSKKKMKEKKEEK